MYEILDMLIMFHFEEHVVKGVKIEEIKNILLNLINNEDQEDAKKYGMSIYEIIAGTASAISGLLLAVRTKYLNEGDDGNGLNESLYNEYNKGYPLYITINQLAESAHEGDENKRKLFDLITNMKTDG